MCQQLTTLEQYNNRLHREKQNLQMEVWDLKRRREFDEVLSQEEQKEIEKLLESDEDYVSCFF